MKKQKQKQTLFLNNQCSSQGYKVTVLFTYEGCHPEGFIVIVSGFYNLKYIANNYHNNSNNNDHDNNNKPSKFPTIYINFTFQYQFSLFVKYEIFLNCCLVRPGPLFDWPVPKL